MQPFPHTYTATASLKKDTVHLESPDLSSFESGAPAEFGGPGNLWSPETLLAAAVADCFILSYKAIANASKFSYLTLTCHVDAILDRQDRVTRFTELVIKPVLTIDDGDQREKAEKLLGKAEATCLITNSLTADVTFLPEVQIEKGRVHD
jgi:peroxiredoxin-like protein